MNRNISIDFFKWIAAILIIAIHTHPLCQMNENVDFWFSEVVTRLAVPFFAVTSGYFLNRDNVKRQQFKVIKKYFGACMLYLPFLMFEWRENNWFSFKSFIDWGVSVFTSGGYYHLRYLLGLIYALPLFLYIIKHILNNKRILQLAIILWIIECLLYTDLMSFTFSIGITILMRIFDITIRILSLLLLGTYIKGKSNSNCQVRYLFMSFVLLVGEVSLIKYLGGMRFSYVLSTFPVAYYVFTLIKEIRISVTEKMKKVTGTSDMIYILHPAIIFVLTRIGLHDGLLLFVLTTIFTMLCSDILLIRRRK